MMWIGLTGSIGSGKSTVAEMLRRAGLFVVDADTLAHEGLKSGTPTYDSIVQKLGKKILNEAGEIQRRELGRLVFADPSLKSWLENLIHPRVQTKVLELRKKLEAEGHRVAFYEVPLLFEKGLEPQFDQIVVVCTSEEIQKKRLQLRNAWSEEEIQQRNQSQWPIAEKIARADYVIRNDGSLQDLQKQVDEFLKKIK